MLCVRPSHSLVGVVRPNSAKSGRPSSPEPGICEALMSRNAKPLTDADPTYPIDATSSAGQLALDDQVPRLDVAAVQLLIRTRDSRSRPRAATAPCPC